MTRTLIVGLDGSDLSEDGLALGVVLAECLGARPLLATVIAGHPHALGSETLDTASNEPDESVLGRAAEAFGGIEVERRTLVGGSPARRLHELAEEVEPLVVVLGSARRGPLGRILLGSVGTALLSGAPCSIAVAPRGYASRETRRMLRICVAINGSEESWPALAAAAGVAGRLHASLCLLGVAEQVQLSHGGQYPALDPGAYLHASERHIGEVLDRAVGMLPDDLPAERRLMRGDPVKLIAAAAADFDLLVLGSRSFGPIRRALLGSVSARLLESSPAPVLVLPRSAGDDPLGLGSVPSGRSSGA